MEHFVSAQSEPIRRPSGGPHHPSPFDLPDLLTQPGQILRELDHHDDEGPSRQHAGGPEQRVEEHGVVVQAGQEDALLLLAGVVVAAHLPVDLQPLGDVHDERVHGRAVLLAPGHVEALRGQSYIFCSHPESEQLHP